MYATLFYGVYDASQRRFTFCNAGHNPPLFFQEKRLRRLDCGGTVVGMFSDSAYEQEAIPLGSDDVLVIYSDGLTELTNDVGEDFGEPRLARLLEDHSHLSAVALKDLILARANTFSNGVARQDDLTVVVIKSKYGPP
jgi:sigma-B regulation protein RsbU (phosphoserine phosphatase)